MIILYNKFNSLPAPLLSKLILTKLRIAHQTLDFTGKMA